MALKRKKAYCTFCVLKKDKIDYKDIKRLVRFISSFHRILPRRYTGNCVFHQKMVSTAIKRSRQMALLPYTDQHKLLVAKEKKAVVEVGR